MTGGYDMGEDHCVDLVFCGISDLTQSFELLEPPSNPVPVERHQIA